MFGPEVGAHSRSAVGTVRTSVRISIRSPASIAASAPLPIAMPMSATASATESLTPSPTMATVRPCACKRFTASAFSVGSTPAITSAGAIPTASATCWATAALSPVSNIGVMPMDLRSAIAAALSGFIRSASVMTPRSCPPQTTCTAV